MSTPDDAQHHPPPSAVAAGNPAEDGSPDQPPADAAGSQRLEEAVRAYLAGTQSPLVDWKFRERITAVRAAAVLSDDMAGATALLMQVQMDLTTDESAEPPSEELIASVLGFSVSDTAMQLRKRLNLLIK